MRLSWWLWMAYSSGLILASWGLGLATMAWWWAPRRPEHPWLTRPSRDWDEARWRDQHPPPVPTRGLYAVPPGRNHHGQDTPS